MKADPVNLTKFMIRCFSSSAVACIILVSDDELPALEKEGQVPTQCHILNSDPTIIAIRYDQSKRLDEQVNRHKAVHSQTKFRI